MVSRPVISWLLALLWLGAAQAEVELKLASNELTMGTSLTKGSCIGIPPIKQFAANQIGSIRP